jgi:hypothetical protein
MCKAYTLAAALSLAVLQSGCAAKPGTSLTQWGTPCSDYGLTDRQCHARFTGDGQFLAQSDRKTSDRDSQ